MKLRHIRVNAMWFEDAFGKSFSVARGDFEENIVSVDFHWQSVKNVQATTFDAETVLDSYGLANPRVMTAGQWLDDLVSRGVRYASVFVMDRADADKAWQSNGTQVRNWVAASLKGVSYESYAATSCSHCPVPHEHAGEKLREALVDAQEIHYRKMRDWLNENEKVNPWLEDED